MSERERSRASLIPPFSFNGARARRSVSKLHVQCAAMPNSRRSGGGESTTQHDGARRERLANQSAVGGGCARSKTKHHHGQAPSGATKAFVARSVPVTASASNLFVRLSGATERRGSTGDGEGRQGNSERTGAQRRSRVRRPSSMSSCSPLRPRPFALAAPGDLSRSSERTRVHDLVNFSRKREEGRKQRTIVKELLI